MMKTNPRVLYAGTLSVVTSIVLLVALVALNMLIGLIPDRLTQLDLTSNKIYSVSQTTKDYLSSLKEDVTVYVLCADGDASVILAPLLDRFGSYPHVKVENVNTTLHPEFKDAYTEDELDNYSIIVESARRYQVIGYYDMMFYQHETLGQIPYQEYQKNVLPNATLYQYYYQVDVTTAVLFFDGEHVLTSAIEYVSLTSIPHAYTLTSHGETVLPENLFTYLNQLNFTVETLDLKTGNAAIPEDCSVLLINDPETDLSEEEASLFKAYLAGGGHILLLTNPGCSDLTRLMDVCKSFGMEALDGTLYDGSAYHDTLADYNLYPIPAQVADNTSPVYGINYLPVGYRYHTWFPKAHAIGTTAEAPDGIDVYDLQTTSPEGQLKTGEEMPEEKGTYAVGSIAVKSDTGGKLAWYSCADAFTEAGATSSSGGNYIYLYCTLAYLSDKYESTLGPIYSISLAEPVLNTTQSNAALFVTIGIVLVPLAVLAAGITVWAIRRRR